MKRYFPDISLLRTGNMKQKFGTDIDFCKYLLETQGLAIVPGAAFGDDTCVRFSYAASDETLAKACDRFEKGILGLHE